MARIMTRVLLMTAFGLAGGAYAVAAVPDKDDDKAPTTVSFTSVEAVQGAGIYGEQCAACHGGRLEGASAPALKGPAFLGRWTKGDRTYETLDHAIRQMPKQAPNSLSGAQYGSLLAYILTANGYRAGPQATSARIGMSATMHSPDDLTAMTAKKPSGPALVLPSKPTSVAAASGTAPTAAEVLNPGGGDWLMFNRTYKGDRFSPLSQINAGNAARLQPVCILQMGVLGSFQGAPLVYNGLGFVTTTYDTLAFNPATCERGWQNTYSPEGDEGMRTNRGATLYEGKLFRGTTDAHLIALDAATGKQLWNVHVADASKGYAVGAAPVVYKGKVIVGLSGGDFGTPGKVFAFDANTGALAWTFDTIDRKSWKMGAELGGGATWTTVAVDPTDGLVYVPIGNPAPDFAPGKRPGDNLYTNSVVALDIETGKLRWYVQQLPGDFHDWDTAAAPALYERNGKRYMAVGTKAGYVYVYDRDTHALVARTSVVNRKNEDIVFGADPVHVCPGPISGIEWNGPAFSKTTGALYVNSIEWCASFSLEINGHQPGILYMEGNAPMDPPSERSGWFRALDGATGKELWALRMPSPMLSGVTPTAGGIVMTGGANGEFLVLDQATGKTLYRFQTGGQIGGGISTYLVNGKQYVAVATGGQGLLAYGPVGAPTLVVFALPD